MTARRRARGVTWAQVVQTAHRLPGVHDGTSYGTPALFVRKKLFIRLRDDDESIAVRTDPVSRDLLLRADPAMYFLTDHYLNYPWILVKLSAADADALAERIEDAWRLVAGKRLIAERVGR
ncbi:MAG: MmcQ/YjbR family DNA-binding protein [Gemmatimonadales bacterium]